MADWVCVMNSISYQVIAFPFLHFLADLQVIFLDWKQ